MSKKPDLTRDQRLEIHTLRELKWTYPKIATHLDISIRQAEYAAKQPLTPKKKGRPPLLDTPKRKELVDFVISSIKTRQMPYPEIPRKLDWSVCGVTIKNALNKEGFHRCRIARVKPVLTEKNKKARLTWAREHLQWSKKQWDSVLWTDECYVYAQNSYQTWVT